MTNTAISWSTPEEWVLKLAQTISTYAYLINSEEETFWSIYSWTDNRWIVDQHGKPLASQKYDKIHHAPLQTCKFSGLWFRHNPLSSH